ncbi:band 4.1-like protein 1 isoform X2 [Saccostrea echinata]|uniref:band 4.1-like protein 1 isoform X2 n=1 Tax=Saccostrea echinata TaxID=191078 RepID=UPI002A80BA3E|nr:band 4.1-like protein 1 isoform X2 [Saccostrea echinata]
MVLLHAEMASNSIKIMAPTAEPEVTYSPALKPAKVKDRKDSVNRESRETVKPTQHKSNKMVLCRVLLLDGNDFETDINRNAEGKELFEEVCKKLNISEKEYFGLTYTGAQDVKYWLNLEKKISKQVKSGTWVFEFAVKFYPPEPSHLHEDITRYQICLQIRADIYNGKLPCSFMTHAILGSYTVQAEIGDYDPQEDGPDDEYLKAFDFAPQQTPELSQKIHELHKTHKGQTPEEAELNFLENAKKLAMYGVDLHKAKDSQNQVVMLGVCSSGIQLYRDKLRINRFVWPKIIKLTYKRNNFYIKIRPSEGEQETTLCFKLDSHKLAKRLWKTCVEHHTFFRLKEPENNSTGTLIPRFNSRFRYSGRTQKQIREQEDLIDRPKVKVERRGLGNSFRMPRDAEGHIIRHNADGQNDAYDRTDKLTGHTDTMSSGPPPYSSMDRGDKSHRKHGETEADQPDTTEDRRDKMLGNHEKTEGMPGEGGDAATLEGVGALHGGKKSKEDKEREKREKEEEKQRKKEEEKERKRLEKEKKKHKDHAEDRTDIMGDHHATETAINGTSGTMGLDSDAVVLGKEGNNENAPKSGGEETAPKSAPKEGEDLEHVKHDKAHDKHKDKKEHKKGGGLFGMLKKTPSKGKGDKHKSTETEINNKDSPTDKTTDRYNQENKNEKKDKQKSGLVPEENIEDEVFAESDSVKPVIESNSKLVSEVKGNERKSSSSSSSSDEGEVLLEHRSSRVIEEEIIGPSSPTHGECSAIHFDENSIPSGEDLSKLENKACVKVVNDLVLENNQQSASQEEEVHKKGEQSPKVELKDEVMVKERKVEINVEVKDKLSSDSTVTEISKTTIVSVNTPVSSDKSEVTKSEEKSKTREEVCKEPELPPEVCVVLTNEEAGKEDTSDNSKIEEKKTVEVSKEEKKRQKEEEKRKKQEEKERKKHKQVEKKRKEKEEKERKKKEKLEAKRKKSGKEEVEEKQETQDKSEAVPSVEEGKETGTKEIVEETKSVTKTESGEHSKDVNVKIKVLPKSNTDTSLLGQEVYDEKSKDQEDKRKEKEEEENVKEKQEEKDQKNKKSKKKKSLTKKKSESKKKSSTGCFSFVRHHKSSDDENEAARIELPTEPWQSEQKDTQEPEKPPEEPEVKTPPRQKGGVGMGWALPGMNELKDRKAKQGGLGLDGTHPEYSDKSIDRKMQFIAVTPPTTEVRDRQKGDHLMPFFEPVGSTSDGEGEGTLGKKKPPPVAPKKYRNSTDDSLSDMPPTVTTERMRYDPNMDDRPIPTTNVPIVKTQTRTVTYEKDGVPLEIEDGILISSQSHSTRTQTIETTTYKTERDGKTETRVEKKVVISQEENGDDIDHDALLAEAIKSVTEMNPDLSVERIECMRQMEEVDGRY